jgi:hypothetical protein
MDARERFQQHQPSHGLFAYPNDLKLTPALKSTTKYAAHGDEDDDLISLSSAGVASSVGPVSPPPEQQLRPVQQEVRRPIIDETDMDSLEYLKDMSDEVPSTSGSDESSEEESFHSDVSAEEETKARLIASGESWEVFWWRLASQIALTILAVCVVAACFIVLSKTNDEEFMSNVSERSCGFDKQFSFRLTFSTTSVSSFASMKKVLLQYCWERSTSCRLWGTP